MMMIVALITAAAMNAEVVRKQLGTKNSNSYEEFYHNVDAKEMRDSLIMELKAGNIKHKEETTKQKLLTKAMFGFLLPDEGTATHTHLDYKNKTVDDWTFIYKEGKRTYVCVVSYKTKKAD